MMLENEEYGSDSSDEDYKPGGESEVSEEEGEGDPENFQSGDGDESGIKKKRQKKQSNKPRKKKMLVLEDEKPKITEEKDAENEGFRKEIENEKLEKKKEDEKNRADDLFAAFMKDVGGPRPRRPAAAAGAGLGGQTSSTAAGGGSSGGSRGADSAALPRKVTVTKVFDFAGETVTVSKDVDVGSREAKQAEAPAGAVSMSAAPKVPAPPRRGGLANLVAGLKKAPKMSVLEKSNLDWKTFKKSENIEEELEQHKRSNNSFLEKQDFLQRADQRQFELEKLVRDRHRTPR